MPSHHSLSSLSPVPGSHLRAEGISHSYGARRVLTDVSLSVPATMPTGLLGENGAGKSTLLRILCGIETPDAGEVSAPGPVGLLCQELPFDPSRTRLRDLVDDALARARRLERELQHAGEALATAPGPEATARYDLLLAQATIADVWHAEARAREILAGLGAGGIDPERLLAEVSGGQRGRLALAHLLIERPTTLLLDEPTNHLDEDGARFLARLLAEHPGPVLVASHDRAFLDEATVAQLDLDESPRPVSATGGGLSAFTGTFTDYLLARLDARERWERQFRQEQEELETLRRSLRDSHQVGHEGRGPRTEARGAKKFYADRNAAVVSRRVRDAQRRLETLEREQVRRPPTELHLPAIPEGRARRADGILVDVRGAAVRDRLAPADLTVASGDKVLITGPNGSGKSTLLSLLSGTLKPTAGIVDVTADRALLAQDEHLDAETTVRALLADAEGAPEAEPGDLMGLVHPRDLDRPLGQLSRGQQRRAELLRLLRRPPALLLLDEPTNHLALDLATRLERAVQEWPGTVVIASHDRWLTSRWTGPTVAL